MGFLAVAFVIFLMLRMNRLGGGGCCGVHNNYYNRYDSMNHPKSSGDCCGSSHNNRYNKQEDYDYISNQNRQYNEENYNTSNGDYNYEDERFIERR